MMDDWDSATLEECSGHHQTHRLAAETAFAELAREKITYHEAGTLWMRSNPATSVTDTNGRFHHISNAYCTDQSLFVNVGSVNPTLTGLVLSRKVAEAVVARATATVPPP